MKTTDDGSAKKIIRRITYFIIGALIAFLLWFFMQYGGTLYKILTGANPTQGLTEFLEGFGVFGVLVLILFQTLQIAIACIPGEPIELAAGMMYGTFFGGIVCLVGVLLGSLIVYYAVATFGQTVIAAFHDDAKFQKMSRLRMFQSVKSAELLTAILFFVPAMPKDFLTFLAPLTPMRPFRFFLLSTLARAPGMFITTYAGRSLLQGNWKRSVLLYAIMGVVALIGFLYYRKISAQNERA